MTQPLLAIFAHPDDETFTSAGVLAAASERGVPVTLVSATRGEAGESAIPDLDDPARLGVVRERELRDAMRAVGVDDVRFLDSRDSGLAGSPAAADPHAFVNAPMETVAATLAALIRTIRPCVILTFGPDGLYGHPDHLHMHHAALAAVRLAADLAHEPRDGPPWRTPSLYYATFPREEMLLLFDRPNNPLEFLSDEARAGLGTPIAQITHVVDIRPWAERKRAAIAAHRTQTGEGGPLVGIPDAVREAQLANEWFVRAPIPGTGAGAADDVIAELADDRPRG
jgi:LmbE family N-acetylglucosaminyl deacetylase